MKQVPAHDHLLYQITHRIRQSLDLDDILETAVREIQAFLGVDRVKIYRFEPDGSGQVVAEAVNLRRLPTLRNLRFPATDIPAEARDNFVRMRQRVIVDVDAQHREESPAMPTPATGGRYHAYRTVDPCHIEYLKAMGVASSLVMPILHQADLWGLLAVHHSKPRRFDRQELTILRLLADQIEIAIAQAVLLQQARHQSYQETIVNQISSLLHCPLDIDDIYQRVLETTVTALGGNGGRLYMVANPMSQTDALYVVGTQPHRPLETISIWRQFLDYSSLETSPDPESTLSKQVLSDYLTGDGNDSLWQQMMSPIILNVDELHIWPQLAEAFAESDVQTLLLSPLKFQGEYLGYVAIFRGGYDEEILWAGHRNLDDRNERPRISFEAWREIRRNQMPLWTREDLRLMQAITLHLYLFSLQQQLTAKLRYQAYHDSLTKLANRVLFTEQLALTLLQADQSQEMVAVGFLDLDRFKNINDTLGHELGDRLLTVIADRLRDCLRNCDIVARWGGDEFTLILPELSTGQEVVDLAHTILSVLSLPMHLGGQELVVTASLGLAVSPYDGDTVETLLKHADLALHQAKRQGRNTFHLFQKGQSNVGLSSFALEGDLRRAIEQEELCLWYQPQVKIATGELIGIEALVRWNHPRHGMILPGRFIPLAEESGLIKPLGNWALEAACAQHRQWCKEGLPPLRIAVNLSAIQLQDPRLLLMIEDVLSRYQVPPSCLEVEITETVAMQDVYITREVLRQLQTWGVAVALDDFGMGYSSLNTIKHLPVQTLKIDKSFVQDAVKDSSDAAIAKTIVALGKGLGLSVLAEGVETPQQLQFLHEIACDHAQGYLFGHPVPPETLSKRLLSAPRLDRDRLYLLPWQAA